MNTLYTDRLLIDDAVEFLTDLHGAGIHEVSEMALHLQATFFTEEWETFLLLQNWIATVQLKKEKEKTQ